MFCKNTNSYLSTNMSLVITNKLYATKKKFRIIFVVIIAAMLNVCKEDDLIKATNVV